MKKTRTLSDPSGVDRVGCCRYRARERTRITEVKSLRLSFRRFFSKLLGHGSMVFT